MWFLIVHLSFALVSKNLWDDTTGRTMSNLLLIDKEQITAQQGIGFVVG